MNIKKGIRAGHPLRAGLLLLIASLVAAAALAGCGEEKQPSGKQAGSLDEKQSAEPTKTAASQAPGSDPIVSESKQGDFVYRLIVEPPQGADAGGKPKLLAELEYVGDKDEVTIYHAASPFFFFLKETTRDYDIGYMMNQPLITTKLRRGEPMQETYRGGGGYSEKDSKDYIDFVNELAKTGFPAGQYEAAGRADFYTRESGKRQDYTIDTQAAFNVGQ